MDGSDIYNFSNGQWTLTTCADGSCEYHGNPWDQQTHLSYNLVVFCQEIILNNDMKQAL